MQGEHRTGGPWPQPEVYVPTCLERHHSATGSSAEDVAGGLIPWGIGKEPVRRLSVWRHDCHRSGALIVALTQSQVDGGLPAESVLEVSSCDGEPCIVAPLSTDSGPEAHGPGRVQQARKLLVLLHGPSAKLVFRPAQEGRSHPTGSDAESRQSEHPRFASSAVSMASSGGLGRISRAWSGSPLLRTWPRTPQASYKSTAPSESWEFASASTSAILAGRRCTKPPLPTRARMARARGCA